MRETCGACNEPLGDYVTLVYHKGCPDSMPKGLCATDLNTPDTACTALYNKIHPIVKPVVSADVVSFSVFENLVKTYMQGVPQSAGELRTT